MTSFLDRDSSWLDFNERVLFNAFDESVPLLERVRFLSITAHNLDEFFQVRIGKSDLSNNANLLGEPSRSQELVERAHTFMHEQNAICARLLEELGEHDIFLSDVSQLSEESATWLSEYFDESVYPVLTPLAVDPAHPFPWISSLSINLAFILREPKTSTQRFARVKLPSNLERLIHIPGTTTFVPLEEVIQHYWERLFPGMDLESCFVFRVTRSSYYNIDSTGDLLQEMSSVVRKRKRFGRAVRLEIQRGIDDTWSELIRNEITITNDRVFYSDNLIDLSALSQVASLPIASLRYPAHKPLLPARLHKVPTSRANLFSVLKERDLLIHRPYESYEDTVEALVHQAARDPYVLAIKQTLYRAASIDSPVVRALCRAAEEGKQVVALVELKARFEEQTNIERAKVLERSGVHVVYGKVGLKTHAKLLHIVRNETGTVEYYSHISTGNYNPSTAGQYEDFDLFTADARIGRDVGDLFNNLTGYTTDETYRELIVAPSHMRTALLDLIAGQSHSDGSIVMKCNNLVDPTIATALIEAADAGAHVSVIVRASCAFTPEIIEQHPGIHVTSIIGRFLEHSRIYRFGLGDEATILIGSADMMQRNLDHRVEVLLPLHTEHVRRYVNEALTELMSDENDHWTLTPTGWTHTARTTTAHQSLMDIASFRADTGRKWGDESRNTPRSQHYDK